MKLIMGYEILEALAKGLGKPVMHISFESTSAGRAEMYELQKAAPYLFDGGGIPRFAQIMSEGQGYLVCEDEEEMHRLFDQTVGDDGPTASNSYDGPVRVTAETSDGWSNT